MDNRQIRTMQTFDHVLLFLKEHPVKPEPPLLGRMRESLTECARRLREMHHRQGTAHGRISGSAKDHKADRNKLRKEMMALVRIARPLLKFAPDVELVMRVPHARSDAETVAKAAVEMANVLAPHNALLVDAGYERAYLEDLRARAMVLVDAAGDSVRAREERGRLTADIADELKEGMRALTVL